MKRTILITLVFVILTGSCMAGAAEGGDTTMKVQIEMVRTDSFSMDYIRFGRGDRTLVMLPGLSVNSVMNYADAVADAYSPLTEEFTVYLFDRRKELPETYTIYDMARDTAAAVRTLGLGRVSLFGASQGGMIAMAMAAGDPEGIDRLVLGSTAARMGPDRYRVIGQWAELAKEGDAEALYLAFGQAVYPEEVFEQARELLAESAKSVTEEDLARFVVLAEGIKGFDFTGELRQIACPVLIIGSADDRVLGADSSEEIAEQLKDRPDCELYLYDGYGHAVYDLAPDNKERLLRFLTEAADE